MTTVSLKGIKKAFSSVYTLHGIDLEIKDGEFIVFVGPSDCGKSTLRQRVSIFPLCAVADGCADFICGVLAGLYQRHHRILGGIGAAARAG